MTRLTQAHRAILIYIGKRAREELVASCPLESLNCFPDFKKLIKDLQTMGLISVRGSSVSLSPYGWSWICAIVPEIVMRKGGKKESSNIRIVRG